MKFTINKQAFVDQLAHVMLAIPSKPTIPILTNIKLEASAEGLTLIGSDSDISIESFIDIEEENYQLVLDQSGSILVGARLFNDIIRKAPEDKLMLEASPDHLLRIQSGESETILNGQPGSNYPHLPEIQDQGRVYLPSQAFKELISRTIFSTSNQESRPILTGINLAADGGALTGVATDSHRLSQQRIFLEEAPESLQDRSLTIPKKTLQELVKIVGDEDSLWLYPSDKQVLFKLANLTIYSRLLEGAYPDTDSLIPQDFDTELVVHATSFYQAIDRAATISHQGKLNIVTLDISSDQVDLFVPGNERGKATEMIHYLEATGEPLSISFNPDYMKDALRSFGNQAIKLQFQSPVRPFLMSAYQPERDADGHLLQLLTPIRTH